MRGGKGEPQGVCEREARENKRHWGKAGRPKGRAVGKRRVRRKEIADRGNKRPAERAKYWQRYGEVQRGRRKPGKAERSFDSKTNIWKRIVFTAAE